MNAVAFKTIDSRFFSLILVSSSYFHYVNLKAKSSPRYYRSSGSYKDAISLLSKSDCRKSCRKIKEA